MSDEQINMPGSTDPAGSTAGPESGDHAGSDNDNDSASPIAEAGSVPAADGSARAAADGRARLSPRTHWESRAHLEAWIRQGAPAPPAPISAPEPIPDGDDALTELPPAQPAVRSSGSASENDLAVVAWGGEEDDDRAPTGWRLARLRADQRTAAVLGGLGALAVFASLIGEWQVTTLNISGDEGEGPTRVATGVAGLAGWSTGYLLGVFGLAASLTLVLFGARPQRATVRLIGLSTGGVLLGLLVAATAALGERSTAFNDSLYLAGMNPQAELEYGRGLFAAYAGVAALLGALYLAGRWIDRAPAPTVDADPAAPEEFLDTGSAIVRQRTASEPEFDDADRPSHRRHPVSGRSLPGPLDLTVEPATPFVHLPPETDRPA